MVRSAPPAAATTVGTRRRCHRETRRPRRGALGRGVPDLGHRTRSQGVHAHRHRQRESPHRRLAGHPAAGTAHVGALPRLGGRYRLGGLSPRHNRNARRAQGVPQGDRYRPGPGEPPDVDHAACRSGAHPQTGVAPRRGHRRPGPVPGGLDDAYRRSVGQPRGRRALQPQLRRFRRRHRHRLRAGEVVDDHGTQYLHRRLYGARGSRRVVGDARRPHHYPGPHRGRGVAAVHGAADHAGQAEDTTGVQPVVGWPEGCVGGSDPGHQPSLPVADRISGRADRRDVEQLSRVHAIRRRRSGDQLG